MPKVDEILEFGIRLPPTVYRVSKSKYPPMQVPPKAVQGSGRFDNPGAIQLLRERMSLTLMYLKLSDLDFSHVLGDNRDLTRAISRWIWSLTSEDGDPLFSGIRYRSRFDPECICLALYEGRFSIDGDIATQPITSETPGLAEAASILRLQIA